MEAEDLECDSTNKGCLLTSQSFPVLQGRSLPGGCPRLLGGKPGRAPVFVGGSLHSHAPWVPFSGLRMGHWVPSRVNDTHISQLPQAVQIAFESSCL